MKKYTATILIFLSPFLHGTSQSLISKLDSAINSYVADQKFTGTVLIARKGSILLQKGYGYSNAAAAKPNGPASIFQVASLAKPFTAAVVLKLQEQGRLSLQDKLSKYYPGYPNADNITIHQLLSHTAGIFDYTSSEPFRSSDQSQPVSMDTLIGYFINEPVTSPPGTRFRYSNSGYTLLGYIIEKITRKSYRENLEEMILQPLQLTHTGYDFTSLTDSNATVGYNFYAPGLYKKASYVHPSILYTTGALYSTVGDLYKWHQALMGNSFLTAASKKQWYKPVIAPYAYGWFSDSLFGRKRISHDGNVSGFKANINRMPDEDLCVIALSNSNSSQVGQMVRVLMSILYDQPYKLPAAKKDLALADSILNQYAGTYQFSPETIVHVLVNNKKLYLEGPTQP
ncbi:MAG: class A beta-lactamase-related serine hydrolase, partial [Chitinophagaceae bacterium]